jgi:hypothetical protein
VGVDSAWEQEKLEARKMLEKAAESQRRVHAVLGKPDERKTRYPKKILPST